MDRADGVDTNDADRCSRRQGIADVIHTVYKLIHFGAYIVHKYVSAQSKLNLNN